MPACAASSPPMLATGIAHSAASLPAPQQYGPTRSLLARTTTQHEPEKEHTAAAGRRWTTAVPAERHHHHGLIRGAARIAAGAAGRRADVGLSHREVPASCGASSMGGGGAAESGGGAVALPELVATVAAAGAAGGCCRPRSGERRARGRLGLVGGRWRARQPPPEPRRRCLQTPHFAIHFELFRSRCCAPLPARYRLSTADAAADSLPSGFEACCCTRDHKLLTQTRCCVP